MEATIKLSKQPKQPKHHNIHTTMTPIIWDSTKAVQFLKVYTDTKDEGGSIFNFEGVEWPVSYATYMVQYFLQKGMLTPKDFK